MHSDVNIPAALNRLCKLITQMGYTCEIIDEDELFVFTATTYTDDGEELCININVTANGENNMIGTGNYIALEVFVPCNVTCQQDELNLSFLIMNLLTEVDLTTVQYVPEIKQILISRVDCISNEIPDKFIVNHILNPVIKEFLHIFYLIENTPQENTLEEEIPQLDTPLDNTTGNKYLN